MNCPAVIQGENRGKVGENQARTGQHGGGLGPELRATGEPAPFQYPAPTRWWARAAYASLCPTLRFDDCGLTQAELLERLGDVGALVLGRLDAAGLHQIISVLVPFAVGEIMPEHGGRGLRLAD